MVRFKYPRIWKGEHVNPGDPVEGTERERQALLDCGQAYREVSKPDSDNTVKEIKAYLDNEGIDYTADMLKDELLDQVQ